MSTSLVTMQPNGAALFADDPAERRRMFLNLIQKNINEDQLRLLFGICDRYGFDPMLKHVILIQQGMYVTRDGMLQYAHRTGLFNGMEEVEKSQDKAGKWRVTVAVYRKGCERPFVETAFQVEHENEKSTPWQKSPYRMTKKCAALAALRAAFPVELGGAEEVGYDGVSARTNIGTATIIDAEVVELGDAPAPGADPIAALVASLRAMDADGVAFQSIVAEAQKHADRVTPAQWEPIKAAVKAIAARRKAAAKTASADPGYQQHARDDKQPILGDSPDSRLAMLARIRAAMAAAGKSEEQVNRFVGATYNVASFDVLTEAQAEELIAILEARGDDEEAVPPVEMVGTVLQERGGRIVEEKRYPDDSDSVPF
jgi:hypothetical protein